MADLSLPLVRAINWRQPVTVSVGFKTNIFTAREGLETRHATRKLPRVSVEFSLLGGITRDPGWRETYAAALAGHVEFPDFPRKAHGSYDGSGQFSGSFPVHRFPQGATVFVEAGAEMLEATITANDGATLAATPITGLSAGEEAALYPSLSGRVAAGFTARYATSLAHDAAITLEAYGSPTRVLDLAGNPPVQTYRGLPALLWPPNWAERVQESWTRDEFNRDLGYGLPFWEAKNNAPIRAASHTILIRSAEEADELCRAFVETRGRQGAFYAPTWTDDFILDGPVAEGQTLVPLKGQQALALYNGSDTFQSVALRRGRNLHLVGIVSLTAAGQDSEMVLAQPVPADVAGATRGSWLLKQRFASDTLEVSYRTDRIAEVDVKTVSLIEDLSALQIAGFNLTINDYYITIGA